MKAEGHGLLVQATAEMLRSHAPFNAMAPQTLRWLAARLGLAYFPPGAQITGPERGRVQNLYIVKQGVVNGKPSAQLGREGGIDLVHGAGECFPIAALLAHGPTPYVFEAASDVFLYELREEDFGELLDKSPPFRAFCTDHLSSLLEQSRAALRAQAAASLADEGRMHGQLRAALRRAPVSCAPEAPIREVLRAMARERVGSMVVTDAARVPVGIFTEADLLRRVVLGANDLAAPIASVMSARPVVLDAAAPVHAAALAMARHGIRHVVIVDDGRLAGVVSERDLFSMQQASVHGAWKRIRAAESGEQLAEAAAEVRRLLGQFLAQGMSTQQLTGMMSALSDGVVQAAVRIGARDRRAAGRYCWMALGSEGRTEQTLATDQDNGLVFEQEADRELLLALAADVNLMLEHCGYPLCKGNIMARNPQWCASRAQWRTLFAGWIDNPMPKALLNAAIFFDLRAVAGEPQFVSELRDWLLERACAHRPFLRAMAQNALDSRPPLGILGGLRLEESGEFAGALDLKKFGARPFVDAARVWALAHRLPATGTAERLQAAAAAGALPPAEAASAVEAFYFIQALRLRHQYFGQPQPGAENRIDPDSLNSLDRRILKEALREAATLQQRLRLDFQL